MALAVGHALLLLLLLGFAAASGLSGCSSSSPPPPPLLPPPPPSGSPHKCSAMRQALAASQANANNVQDSARKRGASRKRDPSCLRPVGCEGQVGVRIRGLGARAAPARALTKAKLPVAIVPHPHQQHGERRVQGEGAHPAPPSLAPRFGPFRTASGRARVRVCVQGCVQRPGSALWVRVMQGVAAARIPCGFAPPARLALETTITREQTAHLPRRAVLAASAPRAR